MLALLTAFVFFVAGFVFWKSWLFYRTVYKIPSPPGKLFLGGNFLNVLTKSDQFFQIARSFSASIVALLDPHDVEIVLSSTKHLTKSRIYKYLNQWLGTGLLTSTGVKWHNRRKILTPAFHFEILQQFVSIFNEETKKLVQIIEKNARNKAPIDVIPLVTNFTLQSLGETAMGFKNIKKEKYLEYKRAVYKMGEILLLRLSRPWLMFQSFYNLSTLGKEEQKTVKILRDFTNDIIVQREKETLQKTETKRMAMLDLLLAAKKRGAEIDHDGIREEVDTFMFEGHDTTSMALSFILLTLANQPMAQQKIVDEIEEIVGRAHSPTFKHLQELKYTERCIKETLRLFPSVPFISRRAGEDFTTKTGYYIPKGTILHFHIFDIHRNPVLYPDPLKFDPDRFLPEKITERHPFAYIPFSAGPRNCIGQRFALLELKAALCGILSRFVLEPVDGMFDIEFKPDLVLRPKGEVRVMFVPR